MSPARRLQWFREFLTALEVGERLVGPVAGSAALRGQIGLEIARLEEVAR